MSKMRSLLIRVVLCTILIGITGKSRAQDCGVEFFKEDFDPTSSTAGCGNNASCYARYPFVSEVYTHTNVSNPSNFGEGNFAMLEDYTCTSGTLNTDGKEFCAAVRVLCVNCGGYNPSGSPYYITKLSPTVWRYSFTVPPGKQTVTLSFNMRNVGGASDYFNVWYGFTGVGPSTRMVPPHQSTTESITINVSPLGTNAEAYIELHDATNANAGPSGNLPTGAQIGRIALDNIRLSYTNAGPGDSSPSVCGFGEREIPGPGTGLYNWYAADGTTRLTPPLSPVNTLIANITQKRTEFKVTTTDPTSGCESGQSTVTVNVDGVTVFTDDFNNTAAITGYPQDCYCGSNFVIPRSDMNFTTDYEPVIVRFWPCRSPFGPNCSQGLPGAIQPGRLTVAYDPYSYNPGWWRWPEDITTPLNPSQPNPPVNRFLIVDSKVDPNLLSTSHRYKVWSRNVPVRAGFSYQVRFKMMNALPSGNQPDPATPVVSIGTFNGTNEILAGLVERDTNRPKVKHTIVKGAAWTELTYWVTAPASVPANGELPLTISTFNDYNVPNPGDGRDFLIDDIQLVEFSSLSIPVVSNATQCDPGPVTLTAPAPGAYHWFTDRAMTTPVSPVNQGNSITVSTTQPGTTSFFVQNRIVPTCPSPVKEVKVRVYNAIAAFTVDPQPGTGAPIAPNYTVTFTATPGTGSSTTYTWYWGDQSAPETTNQNVIEHKFKKPGDYAVKVVVEEVYTDGGFDQTTCQRESAVTVVSVFRPLCELVLPIGGSFQKDNLTGATTYGFTGAQACIPSSAFECLSERGAVFNGVVSFTATAFADSLVTDDSDYATAANPFLGAQRRMQPYASYSFVAPLASGRPNYEAGTFAMPAFNWQTSARARPPAWIASSIATRLSPDGQPLQERDALGVNSTAKFGYGGRVLTGTGAATAATAHAVPYLQAQNAEYATVQFESFENVCISCTGNGPKFGDDAFPLLASEIVVEALASSSTAKAHTGSKAGRLVFNGNLAQLTLKTLPVTAQLRQVGVSVKVWVLTEAITLNDTGTKVWMESADTPGLSLSDAPLRLVSQTGEWALFEALVPLSSPLIAPNARVIPHLQFGGAPDGSGGAMVLRVDDVRVQPRDAQMTAYVYDSFSLRLLASFDDQHFGLLYQYNNEGKLIRKQVETERGIKTLQETFYHTPQVPRP